MAWTLENVYARACYRWDQVRGYNEDIYHLLATFYETRKVQRIHDLYEHILDKPETRTFEVLIETLGYLSFPKLEKIREIFKESLSDSVFICESYKNMSLRQIVILTKHLSHLRSNEKSFDDILMQKFIPIREEFVIGILATEWPSELIRAVGLNENHAFQKLASGIEESYITTIDKLFRHFGCSEWSPNTKNYNFSLNFPELKEMLRSAALLFKYAAISGSSWITLLLEWGKVTGKTEDVEKFCKELKLIHFLPDLLAKEILDPPRPSSTDLDYAKVSELKNKSPLISPIVQARGLSRDSNPPNLVASGIIPHFQPRQCTFNDYLIDRTLEEIETVCSIPPNLKENLKRDFKLNELWRRDFLFLIEVLKCFLAVDEKDSIIKNLIEIAWPFKPTFGRFNLLCRLRDQLVELKEKVKPKEKPEEEDEIAKSLESFPESHCNHIMQALIFTQMFDYLTGFTIEKGNKQQLIQWFVEVSEKKPELKKLLLQFFPFYEKICEKQKPKIHILAYSFPTKNPQQLFVLAIWEILLRDQLQPIDLQSSLEDLLALSQGNTHFFCTLEELAKNMMQFFTELGLNLSSISETVSKKKSFNDVLKTISAWEKKYPTLYDNLHAILTMLEISYFIPLSSPVRRSDLFKRIQHCSLRQRELGIDELHQFAMTVSGQNVTPYESNRIEKRERYIFKKYKLAIRSKNDDSPLKNWVLTNLRDWPNQLPQLEECQFQIVEAIEKHLKSTVPLGTFLAFLFDCVYVPLQGRENLLLIERMADIPDLRRSIELNSRDYRFASQRDISSVKTIMSALMDTDFSVIKDQRILIHRTALYSQLQNTFLPSLNFWSQVCQQVYNLFSTQKLNPEDEQSSLFLPFPVQTAADPQLSPDKQEDMIGWTNSTYMSKWVLKEEDLSLEIVFEREFFNGHKESCFLTVPLKIPLSEMKEPLWHALRLDMEALEEDIKGLRENKLQNEYEYYLKELAEPFRHHIKEWSEKFGFESKFDEYRLKIFDFIMKLKQAVRLAQVRTFLDIPMDRNLHDLKNLAAWGRIYNNGKVFSIVPLNRTSEMFSVTHTDPIFASILVSIKEKRHEITKKLDEITFYDRYYNEFKCPLEFSFKPLNGLNEVSLKVTLPSPSNKEIVYTVKYRDFIQNPEFRMRLLWQLAMLKILYYKHLVNEILFTAAQASKK